MSTTEPMTLELALKLADQDSPLPSLAGPALRMLRDRFDAMAIIGLSVARALERHGVTEVDDPGEAIDVLMEGKHSQVASYQAWVEQNWNRRKTPVDGNPLRDLFIMATGIGGEAGEVQELLKKHVRDGREIHDDLLLELGDVLHYLTRIACQFGFSLQLVMDENRRKIDARHAKREARDREDGMAFMEHLADALQRHGLDASTSSGIDAHGMNVRFVRTAGGDSVAFALNLGGAMLLRRSNAELAEIAVKKAVEWYACYDADPLGMTCGHEPQCQSLDACREATTNG